MANKEHLKMLKQGVKAWNEWRDDNQYILPDLSRANLNKVKLDSVNLYGPNSVKQKTPWIFPTARDSRLVYHTTTSSCHAARRLVGNERATQARPRRRCLHWTSCDRRMSSR